MGTYDDLIPKSGASASGGTYDDLIPKRKAAAPAKHTDPFKGLKQEASQLGRNVSDFADWSSRNPLARGVGAVLGTTERFGEGAASGGLDLLAHKKARTNPIKTVLDPEGDTKITHRLEQQEIPKPLAWWNAHTPAILHGEMPHGGPRQTALDLLTQTVHDPATYIPGLDIFTVGGRLARAVGIGRAAGAAARTVGKVIPQVAKDAVRERVEHAKSNLSTSHDTLQGLTQPALHITRAREGGARNLHQQRKDEYHAALAPHEKGINDLDLTLRQHGYTAQDLRDPAKLANIPHAQLQTLHEVNKITDRALWRDGTPQVRRSMLKRGYVPSAEERGLPTANLIERDFGEHYLPEQEIYDPANAKAAKAMKGFSYSRGGVKRSAHNQSKTGGQVNAPLFDRFADRLEASAYLEPKRRAEQSIIKELGFAPSNLPRTQERVLSIQDRIARGAAQPGDAKRLSAYTKLMSKQVADFDKNKQLRDIYTQPGAPHADSPIGGVFSGEQSAQERAARDLSFAGHDTRNAFDSGALESHQSTGVARARRVAADALERRLGGVARASSSTQNRASSKLSKLSLANQKRASEAADRVAQRAQAYGVSAEGRVGEALGREQGNLSRDIFKLAGSADRASTSIRRAASSGALSQQRKVEDAVNALRTKQALERRKDADRLVKNLDKQGVSPNSKLGKAIADMHDRQSARGGGEYVPIKAASISKSMSDITRPSDEISRKSGDLAYNAMTGKYRSKTIDASKARDTSSISRPAYEAAKPVNMSSVLAGGQNLAAHSAKAYRKSSLAAQERRKTLDDLLAKNESIAKVNERVKGDKAYTGDIQLPEALHNRLFGDKVTQEPGVAERLGQDAAGVMFSNPLPHLIGNINEQQIFAGGGPKALLGGIGEAVKLARKDTGALDRLNQAKNVGATHVKGYESEEASKTFPGKAYQTLQRGLTLGHEGQVSELFQRYLGEGKSAEEAAEEVRKTFGRPNESSKEAKKFKAAGSQFANWVLSTLPRSTMKAIGSPVGRNRLKTYARADQDANADVFEPEYGVEFNPGGFASRAANLVLRPAAYAASASLDNVLHSTGTNAKIHPEDLIKEVVPLVGPAMDLIGQPLTPKQRARGGFKKIPWYLKAPLLTGGYYTHAETPMQKLKRELKREGL